MHRLHFQKPSLVLLCMVALVSGCASTRPPASASGPADAPQVAKDPCSVGSSAVIGATAGALLGAILDGERGAKRGAVLGAAAGAGLCVAMNHQSRQTKSAAQTQADYQTARGTLPAEPTLVSYHPQLSSAVIQRDQSFKVSSSVELVDGREVPVREVREELAVFDAQGQQLKSGGKPLNIKGAGRFENSFELKLPANAPQGQYSLKTQLFVNGKLLAVRDLRTQLVWDGRGSVRLAMGPADKPRV